MATVVDELITRLSVENLSGYQAGLGRSADSLAKWTATAATAGAIATATGRYIVDSYKAAADEQATFATASGNFKGSLPVGELEELATRLSRLTAVEDSTIAGTIGLLGTYQMLGSQAKQIILPLLNASRALEAQGQSSEGLAVAIGKAFQGGNLGALRRFGIFVDEGAFKVNRLQALIDALQQQGGDAAVRFGKSASGGMQRFQNSVGDLQEAIGGKLLPVFTPAVDTATKFVEALADNSTAATTVAAILGVTVVGGTVAATRATWQLYSAVVALGNAYGTTGAKAAGASSKMGGASNIKGAGGKIASTVLSVGGFLGGEALAQSAWDDARKHNGRTMMDQLKLSAGRTLEGISTGFQLGGPLGAVVGAVGGAATAIGEGGQIDKTLRSEWETKRDEYLRTIAEESKKQTALMSGGGAIVDFNRLSIAQQRSLNAYGLLIA